ncbi:putative pectate lyase 9A [Treponema primitia ZAS-2]|uniref:Putative pectate lyase 9A n=1 Tax=Treponema primitia (strain ATCC BAA-887 / DSM 12427 / ZAS-2) TaxID=545694 RepID=F5YQU3_TREPZ|nr:bacterial Ig-like domain-containing protein [Treponema primitia]AEF84356.1 putative pectate lyase 9A [Treponema primitia ZAS-2]
MKMKLNQLLPFVVLPALLLLHSCIGTLDSTDPKHLLDQSGPQAPSLAAISISKMPTKLQYALNEAFDRSGLEVTGAYTDSTTQAETIEDSDITGFDSTSPGTKTITVTKGGKTATFTLIVSPQAADPVLVAITISTLPAKLQYNIGELFVWTGLTVTGTYSDGRTQAETIEDSDITGFDSTSPGTKTITVTKGEKTATFAVIVSPQAANPVLAAITISTLPAKLQYNIGESFARTGLTVSGIYTNGSTLAETIEDADITGFDSTSPGTKTITVTKGEKTATFAVIVSPQAGSPVLAAITISKLPAKLQYNIGEAFVRTGLTVIGTYTDGRTQTETIEDADITGFDSTSAGTKMITITKGGKTAIFAVTINTPIPAATLAAITISSLPRILRYNIGDPFNPDGLIVTGTYTGGITKTEAINSLNITGFDSTSPGTKPITITKGGKTAVFAVIVNPNTGSGGITLIPPPATTEISITKFSADQLEASFGFNNYQWFVDGHAAALVDLSSGDRTLTLSPGKHQVWITAYKQGVPYSAAITIEL